MRPAIVFWCAIFCFGVVTAGAAELQSGLQPGEIVGAFEVEKVAGALNDNVKVGTNLCYRCMLGGKPVVMVFARKADKNLAALVKQLDKALAEKASQKLSSFVNLIGAKPDELKIAATEFAKAHDVQNVALVVPHSNQNGPEEFKISPDAEVTVMLYSRGKVAANYALAPGKLDDQTIRSIVADTSKILR